jgi:hypothetical protein
MVLRQVQDERIFPGATDLPGRYGISPFVVSLSSHTCWLLDRP